MKSVTVSTGSPSICLDVMEPDARILVSECEVLSWLFHSPLLLSLIQQWKDLSATPVWSEMQKAGGA